MPASLRVSSSPEPQHADEFLLAQVNFASPGGTASSRCWPGGLRLLSGPAGEYWFTRGPMQECVEDGFCLVSGSDYSWLGAEWPVAEQTDMAALAEELFLTLCRLARESTTPELLRAWVTIPDIHRGPGDHERYKQFCIGRQRAFDQARLPTGEYPAATVIGSHENRLRLQALTGRERGSPLENPRQVSAYRYPRRYGPQSPSFSRAIRLADMTLISGTAAVRGAESQYPGDVAGQLADIRANLAALIHQQAAATEIDRSLVYGRIYLRDAEQLETLHAVLGDTLPQALDWPVLQADICRPELICEVETAYS